MSEMNEFTPDLFELIDEEGNKKQFELFDAAEINGEQYFAMLPAVEDEDFLVDGPFILAQKDWEIKFRGSSNQRFIDCQTSYKEGKAIECEP